MKILHHRVQVNIARKNGTKQEVFGGCVRKYPGRLLHILFGDAREIIVLKPGETVKSVVIKEEKEE